MAGSVRHVIGADGKRRFNEDGGYFLIENLGDAHDAFDEFHDLVSWCADMLGIELTDMISEWHEVKWGENEHD